MLLPVFVFTPRTVYCVLLTVYCLLLVLLRTVTEP
jgi:hypothetical protein